MTASVRSRLDREVRELLRDHPDLIAVAELIASLRPEAMSGRLASGDGHRLRLLTDRLIPGETASLIPKADFGGCQGCRTRGGAFNPPLSSTVARPGCPH